MSELWSQGPVLLMHSAGLSVKARNRVTKGK